MSWPRCSQSVAPSTRGPQVANRPAPSCSVHLRNALALALGVAVAAVAQVSPNGGESQVNSYTTNEQARPAVASDGMGNFVVVWQSYGSSSTDTDDYSVLAQLHSANGSPIGAEFLVNSYTTSFQIAPAVASDVLGNFVVVWQSYGSSGTDTGASIQAQRHDAGGNPLGSQFQVNTFTTGNQRLAAVASDPSGNFVVAWTSDSSSGTDTSGYSVQAQRYDAAGNPLGAQFQVNTYTTGNQYQAASALAPSGNFVVTWMSYGSPSTDTSGWSIQAQRYDVDGNPLGGQFQVNTYATNSQRWPKVTSDAAGDLVVAWNSEGSSGTDTDANSVQAQRFAADGNPLGGQFQVNSYTTSHQTVPAVASDSAGNFVIVWRGSGSSGTDTDSSSVQGQRFRANGSPIGSEFQVNSYTTQYQGHPAVASNGSGNFVVAWDGDGSGGADTSYASVHAQRYDGLFRDGFEGTDWSRWSAAVP